MLIVELKSEALKERHWKTLMRKLHVNWVLSDLSLGQVWDVDLQKNEGIVKDVILVAQGEMALEEFLKQVILFQFHLLVTLMRTSSQVVKIPVSCIHSSPLRLPPSPPLLSFVRVEYRACIFPKSTFSLFFLTSRSFFKYM